MDAEVKLSVFKAFSRAVSDYPALKVLGSNLKHVWLKYITGYHLCNSENR